MTSILSIKKGARVRLRGTGWFATVMDNMTKGHTRLCDVEGIYQELGSVYSTDIMEVQLPNGSWDMVEHTPGQLKARKLRAAAGF